METNSLRSLENQIRPFNITTPDGEVLYAWHVLPLSTYITHEASLIDEPTSHRETLESSMAFKLLAEDRDSRLVISCQSSSKETYA